MKKEFTLCQGVSLRTTGNVNSGYCTDGNSINGILSAELIMKVAKGFIKIVKEPVFFFVELPEEDSEEYDVYFLDNCTKEVALTICKRYGELLAQDGLARFGFGSNSTDEEIYFQDYQEFSVYMKNISHMKKLLDGLEVEQKNKADSLWDLLSDDNVGCLSGVELDGETVYDIPINLKEVGMYKSE